MLMAKSEFVLILVLMEYALREEMFPELKESEDERS